MAVRWWVRFGSLPSADPEFVQARKIVLSVGATSIVFLLAVVALIVFFVTRGLQNHR
jgi:hypothetical protein